MTCRLQQIRNEHLLCARNYNNKSANSIHFLTTLRGKNSYRLHLVDAETEAQRGEAALPRSHKQRVEKLEFTLDCSGSVGTLLLPGQPPDLRRPRKMEERVWGARFSGANSFPGSTMPPKGKGSLVRKPGFNSLSLLSGADAGTWLGSRSLFAMEAG